MDPKALCGLSRKNICLLVHCHSVILYFDDTWKNILDLLLSAKVLSLLGGHRKNAVNLTLLAKVIKFVLQVFHNLFLSPFLLLWSATYRLSSSVIKPASQKAALVPQLWREGQHRTWYTARLHCLFLMYCTSNFQRIWQMCWNFATFLHNLHYHHSPYQIPTDFHFQTFLFQKKMQNRFVDSLRIK